MSHRLTGIALAGLLLALVTGALGACRREAPPFRFRHPPAEARFGERETGGLLACEAIDEASGLAASRMNPGVLWTHNDSGDSPRLFALNERAQHLGEYELLGAEARDWEDMALGPGPLPGRHYLYVADCGDNEARYPVKTIYRLREPVVKPGQQPIVSALAGVESIRYRYPDGPRDAETLIVDPATADLYLVSKREETVHVYRAAFPQATDSVITLEFQGKLPLNNVTAGDVNAAGNEILLKTYGGVFYWTRLPEETLGQALQRAARSLPYRIEAQGEAIAWHPAGMGYYTLSEERQGIPAYLYFYPRLVESEQP